ncbi:MAG: hypothetical protein M1127_03655 [Patescibacteria group bacterium]|nr:hypothetical protein [Patescibacteria group bacterium]
MTLSDIKKLVSDEKKIVMVDGDDVFVVFAFDEYKKITGASHCGAADNQMPLPIAEKQAAKKAPEPEPAPNTESSGPAFREEAELMEKANQELTLEDLPF